MIGVDSKSIALFFFFALMDEQRAMEATSKAIQNYRARMAKHPETKPAITLVASTADVWRSEGKRIVRGRQNFSFGAGWDLPSGLDLGPWKEFQKTAQEDEFLALIWSLILKISDEDIAMALNISIGTLRYRIGKALRKLGALTNPVSVKASMGKRLEVVTDER
jgi:DNA-binding CsgD family transcriptional regulator